jgi:hypothetical protein
MALDQVGAKLAEHAMIKSGIAQFQAEGVFPSQPVTHRLSRLPIGQAFHKLKHRHQCEAPWG